MSPKFNLGMEDESGDIKIGFSGDIKIGPFQKLKKAFNVPNLQINVPTCLGIAFKTLDF